MRNFRDGFMNNPYVMFLLWFVFVGATIKSGASTDVLTVGATSKAARVTLYNDNGESGIGKATYSFSTGAYTPPATPTDTAGICGSSTKTVRVYNIRLSGSQTTAGINRFHLVKRSAADTGGTAVNGTATTHDTNDAATTVGFLGHYTANPTLGATVATPRSDLVGVPATASALTQMVHEFYMDAEFIGTKPITLRGTAQCLYINFGGIALPAGSSWSSDWTYTEE